MLPVLGLTEPPTTISRIYREPKSHLNNASDSEQPDKERERVPGLNEKVPKVSGAEEITTVPNPVPDTGIYTSFRELHDTHHSLLPPSTTLLDSTSSPTFTVTPLPQILSTLTVSNSLFSLSTSAIIPAATTTTPHTVIHPLANSHRRVSVAIVTLLAVGLSFLLLGLFIVTRACSRPRLRVRPTPSLPILKDGHEDHDLFRVDGSPVFGGKEWDSRPGSNGLLTWTQYRQPELVITKPSGGDVFEPQPLDEKATEPHHSIMKSNYPFTGHGSGPAITPANSLQQVQNAVTSILPHLSTASVSLYPGSPNETSMGVAISEMPSLTASSYPIAECTKPEDTGNKDLHGDFVGSNDSNHRRRSQGFAYDGADVSSPISMHITSAPAAALGGGRSRIKSTYYSPGVYRRMSGAPPPLSLASTKVNVAGSVTFEHTLRKSDSRRERNAQALTSALGLDAPSHYILAPPRPMLYPDDSLSIADNTYSQNVDKNPVPKITAERSQEGIMESSTDANIALGNLMLSGFTPTSKSLASLSGKNGLVQASSSRSITKKSFRTDDKPPRVPSPPPLPSLAQMALAHANPEAYADYRSPTYSIYRGLCEGDKEGQVGSVVF